MFFISDHKKRRLFGIRASQTHWGEAGGSGRKRREGRKREVDPGGGHLSMVVLVHSFVIATQDPE